MRKLLVTGGNGLVGSSIISDIKIGKEYDLRNIDETNKMFEYHKPTHIIHCAGKVGGLSANMNYKGEFIKSANESCVCNLEKEEVNKGPLFNDFFVNLED